MNDEKQTPPKRRRRLRRRAQIVKVGDRSIVASGLEAPFFGDLYYHAMRASWPIFFGAYACVFVFVNVLFAVLYSLDRNGIANVRPGSFKDLFFFSTETLGTVGYGDFHPQTDYAHFIATIETFVGFSLLAVVTGLVFSRFSRPQARLIFAQSLVVGPHDGKTCLMVRFANQRGNMIAEATAKLWVVLRYKTAEGLAYRRFHELLLERSQNPVFVLSWTLFHAIDDSSPLFGMGHDELEEADAIFVVTFSGLDEAAYQNVNGRQMFSHRAIRWGHRYADVLGTTPEGVARIDYAKFSDTVLVREHRADGVAPGLDVEGAARRRPRKPRDDGGAGSP